MNTSTTAHASSDQQTDDFQEAIAPPPPQLSTQVLQDSLNEATVHATASRSMEASITQRAHQRMTPDFMRMFPPEILYMIFKHMEFFDFMACVQAFPVWKTILMGSVWPQLALVDIVTTYPLGRLGQYEKMLLEEWLVQQDRQIHDRQSRLISRLLSEYKCYHSVILHGRTRDVVQGVNSQVATLKALVIGSIVSHRSYEDLLRNLADCRGLNELIFSNELHGSILCKPMVRQLSIRSLRINKLHTIPRTHLALLTELLSLCPLLEELVLAPQTHWKRVMRQILQICPPNLSSLIFSTNTIGQASQYKPLSSSRSLQKLSVAINDHHVDILDLHDTIESISGTLEVLCFTFPTTDALTAMPCDTIFRLTECFRHCHKLRTIDFFWGNDLMDNTLEVLSNLPKLETVHFTLNPSQNRILTQQGLVQFFTATSGLIKHVGLYGFNHIIDDDVLRCFLRFSGLEQLKITAFAHLGRLERWRNEYSADMVQQIISRNPKLRIVDTGFRLGIQLSSV
ncbi:hypothetical protein BJV82DRAFT_670085 [Fennellomyces sp. T-0311]|nr:hypothetical protein BJV82DRAFT_670085 [Fennellomyces sp. T-0311]